MALKKTWYDIIAPPMFGEKILAETPASDPRQLQGRIIKVSLADFGREYAKFYLKLVLRIIKVDGSKAYTELIGHDCMYERIYRMVQKRGRRVDSIQDVKTKDGKKVRIKSVLLIPRRVGTSVKDEVRATLRKTVDMLAQNWNYEELIKAILYDDMQRAIKEECKKLYPIGQVEIRKSELLEA